MADHDGHTVHVGPVTIGEPLARPPVAEPSDLADIATRPELVIGDGIPSGIIALDPDERDALVAVGRENAALAAALADIAGMLETGGINDAWVASAECACMGTRLCYERWPGDPGEWCSVCVAEVAWCAWKMGALR